VIEAVHSSGEVGTEWLWPIDVNRYDRTPTLNPREAAILERLLIRSGPRVAHASSPTNSRPIGPRSSVFIFRLFLKPLTLPMP
jgi:hypothetical protein